MGKVQALEVGDGDQGSQKKKSFMEYICFDIRIA